MAWRTPTDAEIAALIDARSEREGVGIVVGVIDAAGRREAVA
jgi:hypothetical protein